MVAYALFLGGAAMFVAARAHQLAMPRLTVAAEIVAWGGPIAAALDLAQDISLALVLGGHHTQPWPLISATTAIITRTLFYGSLLFAICGMAFTFLRRPRTAG